jgi:hypothetical protein
MVASTLMTKTLRQMTASAAIRRSRKTGRFEVIDVTVNLLDKVFKYYG